MSKATEAGFCGESFTQDGETWSCCFEDTYHDTPHRTIDGDRERNQRIRERLYPEVAKAS